MDPVMQVLPHLMLGGRLIVNTLTGQSDKALTVLHPRHCGSGLGVMMGTLVVHHQSRT